MIGKKYYTISTSIYKYLKMFLFKAFAYIVVAYFGTEDVERERRDPKLAAKLVCY